MRRRSTARPSERSSIAVAPAAAAASPSPRRGRGRCRASAVGAVLPGLEPVQCRGRGAERTGDEHGLARGGARSAAPVGRRGRSPSRRGTAPGPSTCRPPPAGRRTARRTPAGRPTARRPRPARSAGRATATTADSGVPPMAAMSLRLTASALKPTSAGLAHAERKCTPSTSRSVAISRPSASTAQSSPTPVCPSGRPGSRATSRSMNANSPSAGHVLRHQARPARRSMVGGIWVSPAARSAARSTLTSSFSRADHWSQGPGGIADGSPSASTARVEVGGLGEQVVAVTDRPVAGHDAGPEGGDVGQAVGPGGRVGLEGQWGDAERAGRAAEDDARPGHGQDQVLVEVAPDEHGVDGGGQLGPLGHDVGDRSGAELVVQLVRPGRDRGGAARRRRAAGPGGH